MARRGRSRLVPAQSLHRSREAQHPRLQRCHLLQQLLVLRRIQRWFFHDRDHFLRRRRAPGRRVPIPRTHLLGRRRRVARGLVHARLRVGDLLLARGRGRVPRRTADGHDLRVRPRDLLARGPGAVSGCGRVQRLLVLLQDDRVDALANFLTHLWSLVLRIGP